MSLQRLVASITEKLYARIIGKKSAQRINNKILNMSLHARGYNNHGTFFDTGELNLIHKLKNHDIKYVIDIGANVGEYSRFVLENLDCNVLAFEPLPKAFQELIRLRDEFQGKFEAHNIGIADHSGVGTLSFGSDTSEIATFSLTNNNLEFVASNNVNSMQVEILSLDDFFDEKTSKINYPRIDLIKIDVEGYEFEVLNGASEIIKKIKPRFIQVEHNRYHLFQQKSVYDFSKILPEYDIYQLLPKNMGLVKRDPADPLTNLFEYSNFLFVNKSIKNNLI